MGAKPLSLADRIRAQKKKNRPASEANSEKELIKQINSISIVKDDKQQNPTSEQTPEQVNKPTSEQMSGQLSGQVNKSTDEQTPEQANKSTSEQLTEQLDRPTSEQPPEQVDTWTSEQTPEQVNKWTGEQVDIKLPENRKPKDLKANQFRVLEHIYFNRPFKVSGPEGIWVKLGIRYGTVRQNLRSLVNKGYIEPHYSINDGLVKGVNCRVVESKCLPLFGPCPIPNPIRQVDKWTIEQTSGQVRKQTSGQTTEHVHKSTSKQVSVQVDMSTGGQTPEQLNKSYSSSSILKNTTTNPAVTILETHPELGYWRQKGLKQRQVQNWMQEFEMSEKDIIDFLCYCRFDMVDNDREEKDRIKDVFAWFYKIVQKTGAYPKPNNYKSHQERQIEREKARLDELKRQAEELRNIRQEATKAEFGLQFEQMLQNPEDPIYQECYEKLPPVMKKRGKKGSIVFEKAMKAEFCRLNDIEDC